MPHALEFIRITFSDFKTFSGQHKVKLKLTPGLYFWTGKNKAQPQMGANGVGKSTVFDALFWCFWGKTIKDSRPANAVVPWNEAKAEPRVCVRFNRDGTAYQLERKRKPNGIWVSKDMDPFKEIKQEDVPGILGMNEETFRRTILIGQFGTMFLDLKPEQQSAMFSEALELDRWLGASKLAAKELANQEDDLRLLTAQEQQLTGRLEELRSQRTSAKAMALAWDESHQTTVNGLAAALVALKAALKRHKDSPVGKPDKAEQLRGTLTTKKQAHAAAVAAERAGVRSLASSEAQRQVTVDAIATARKNVARLEDGQRDKTCPACGQKVTGKHLANELEAARAVVTQLEKQKKRADGEVDAIAEENRLLSKNVTRASNAIDEVNEQISEAEKAFVEWEGKVRAAEVQMKTGQQTLSAAEQAENPYHDTVESLRRRIVKVKDELLDVTGSLTVTELAAGRFKYWVGAFKEIRLSLIDEVLQELEVASSEHAARLGLVDWEIKFQTERENKSGDISYGFNVLLYPPGQKEPVRWESYSGGEDRRWQLAVTFGLSEVLLARAGLTSNLEVLDEPAQHMSAEGVESLLECLADRAREQDKTIFYVDHTSLDRGYFDGIFTVQRTDEGSKVLS